MRSVTVQWNKENPQSEFVPFIYLYGPLVSYDKNVKITSPFLQAVYAQNTLEEQDFIARDEAADYDLNELEMSQHFMIGPTITRTGVYGDPFPAPIDRIIYVGMGPPVWATKFSVTSNMLSLLSYYHNFEVGIYDPGFLQQDFSYRNYPKIPFTIKKDKTIIHSGVIPAFIGPEEWLDPIHLDQASKYEFETTFSYKIGGKSMKSNVHAIFDTANVDSNPPAFKRLSYYSGGVRSEVYDSSVDNTIEIELDAIGGTISSAIVDYSGDETNFISAQVNQSGGVYTGVIPKGLTTSMLNVRVTAKDDVENTLIYTFGLPSGTVAPISPTFTPTPRPCNGQDPCVTPTPTANTVILSQVKIIDANDTKLQVKYSKNFADCAQLVLSDGNITTHSEDLFCTEGENQVKEATLSKFDFKQKTKVKLCKKGDYSVCSGVIDFCLVHAKGDANCDDIVDSIDYVCWSKEYISRNRAPNCISNVFEDGRSIKLKDFAIWRSTVLHPEVTLTPFPTNTPLLPPP